MFEGNVIESEELVAKSPFRPDGDNPDEVCHYIFCETLRGFEEAVESVNVDSTNAPDEVNHLMMLGALANHFTEMIENHKPE